MSKTYQNKVVHVKKQLVENVTKGLKKHMLEEYDGQNPYGRFITEEDCIAAGHY